ncbi:QacE family quaternary ammonium compound efflux SMR transporter [Marinomonas hwangdonensis]|uniref:QacE family quaternary ammonium compound efflux SMR transporter n=1 Tax=Marinomonas hwangdonensis TaxID=1053647 RepID=A0A3M8Q7T0_9GAMM|nr:multidrug efflux SMR transporter [Marinomonas hwangdonensis]RNF51060.1 QacE family quaternary ammonium compound efflux SMR transporter [Marinomonas hwangdonensis]
MTYFILFLAILAEVVATTALKASDSFTKLVPTVILVVGYGVSFYLLTIVMRSMPTGVTYAIWSGLGVVLISLFGYFFAHEKLDLAACIGMSLIVIGVVVINVFSKTVGH